MKVCFGRNIRLNSKFAGPFVIIVLLLFLYAGIDSGKKKVSQACIDSFAVETQTLLNVDVDAESYCGCLVSKASRTSKLEYSSFQQCFSKYMKESFLQTCEEDLNSNLQTGAGMALDCMCIYNEVARLSWDVFSDPAMIISQQDREKTDFRLIMQCGSDAEPQ